MPDQKLRESLSYAFFLGWQDGVKAKLVSHMDFFGPHAAERYASYEKGLDMGLKALNEALSERKRIEQEG